MNYDITSAMLRHTVMTSHQISYPRLYDHINNDISIIRSLSMRKQPAYRSHITAIKPQKLKYFFELDHLQYITLILVF